MIAILKNFWSRGGRVGAILALLAAAVLLARQFLGPTQAVSAASLEPLSLDGVHRLLILAPHCDDETLGAAGLILAAERSGIQVRVVIATNGDGSYSTAVGDLHVLRPHRQDYIRMGESRQSESLAALRVLGVMPEQVDFLSYPDRGLASLWNDHWSASNPYRSAYSGATKSPYPLTYNPKSVYAGEDLLADLESILTGYQPDLIIYPHPDDLHPDHWGLSVFTRLAITLVMHDDPGYRPGEYTYLVHRGDFPTVTGYHPKDELFPPPALYAVSPDWYRWDLTPADEELKYQAVLEYRSQLATLRGLLVSFIRTNELFAPVEDGVLANAVRGNPDNPVTWMDPSGQPIHPAGLDPSHDYFSRNTLPSSDLVALYLARGSEGRLWMCAETASNASVGIAYSLRLKALTPAGIVDYDAGTAALKAGWHPAVRSGRYVCDQIDPASLDNPYALYAAASATGPNNYLLDQVAWQMISVNPDSHP